MQRATSGIYSDPVDLIWLRCARQLGWTVVRSDETYASWDGRGTLTICTPATFDPDDSVAQLILHEICHALVQGPARRRKVDWGLDNTDDDRAAVEEHACHRLQAALLDRYGLRAAFAVTTDWRSYWEALPADPLAAGDDPAIPRARAAWPDAVRGPWSKPLADALRATATIAEAVRHATPDDSIWRHARPLHPFGEALGPDGTTCGDCAWGTTGRCLVHDRSAAPRLPACYRHEPVLADADCLQCGACCREGFHLVPVEDDDELADDPQVVHDDHGAHFPRPGGRCVKLEAAPGLRCVAYGVRPRACRDFEVGGDSCLEARRRVGLTRP